jgi:hypothetical protein
MEDQIISRVGRLTARLAVLVIAAGCAQAPRVVDEPETAEVLHETKDPRRVDPADAASSGEQDHIPGEEEHEDRAMEDPVPTSAPHDAESGEDIEIAGDANSVAPLDASPDEVTDATVLQPDAGAELTDATVPESDAEAEPSRPDAGPDAASQDACDPNPCQHGGTCSSDATGYTCTCSDGYVGARCELESCGNVTIRSRADVEDNRHCAEIQGNLSISSTGLTAVTAEDFPFLTRIRGNLVISGVQTVDGPFLQSVTLAKIRAVEGAVVVLGVAVPEFGGSGPLEELHLPALQSVGGHGGLGLVVYQASLKVLDMPAVTAIQGGAMLHTLFDLCTVDFESLESLGGELRVTYVPQLSAEQLAPLRAAATGAVSESILGCCTSGAEQSVSCDSFTDSARALYCTGECSVVDERLSAR